MLDTETKKIFKAVFGACVDTKAQDVKSLNLADIESYTDVVVLASATSDRQMQAIADRVLNQVHTSCKQSPLGVEGYESAQWILIDFGSVICHVFLDSARPLYHLEDMWPQVRPMLEKDTHAFLLGSKKKIS